MPVESLLLNPLMPRALVLGLFGGAGLVLTSLYARRGPAIYPVYAAFLTLLAFELARYDHLTYAARFSAALSAFIMASAALWMTTLLLADRARRDLVIAGRLPAAALRYRRPLVSHAWRLGALLLVGLLVSAGVAFVAA
ncbi:MAG: hypothetical protein ABIT20_22240 [Gemmatimonadaceae bacterium]